MANEEKEDRISSLPDCLLLEIISLIKIKPIYCTQERAMRTDEVIKTIATISKRWQHLWTKLPTLDFGYSCDGDYHDDFTCIDQTLTQCPTDVDLNKLKLALICCTRHTSQVNRWIRYAITRNVQEVDIWLWDEKTGDKFSFYDELFFNNSCITRMKLFSCVFNPPNGTIRWDKLKYLCIEKGKLVGDSIGKILSGSPCLETLELDNCYGVSRIHATSKRFKNLVLTNYGMQHSYVIEDYIDTMEINAPNMLSLTIKGKLCLETLLLQNVSSLVKVDFNYLSSNRFAHKLGRDRDDIEEELLRGLLSSLGHVNDITLGDYNCLQALTRLRAKGFQLFRAGDEDRITELIDSGWKKVADDWNKRNKNLMQLKQRHEKVEEAVESDKTEAKVEMAESDKTGEKVEETEESDDEMGIMGFSLFE